MAASTIVSTTLPPDAKIKPLLQADYSDLVAINFQVDDQILKPLVPAGLELDYFAGETFVSLVAMKIKRLKIWGLPFSLIPAFPEISLRFYVRRTRGDKSENGTCLIKDYVGGATAAWYLQSQFKSEFAKLKIQGKSKGFVPNEIPEVEYRWKYDDQWNNLRVRARSRITNTGTGTKVGFILEHSNYFASQKGRTIAYRVERPQWEVWDAAQANFNCDVKNLFGRAFIKPLSKRPASVFVSAGSHVTVYRPSEIR